MTSLGRSTLSQRKKSQLRKFRGFSKVTRRGWRKFELEVRFKIYSGEYKGKIMEG